jgi:hypothetical protein
MLVSVPDHVSTVTVFILVAVHLENERIGPVSEVVDNVIESLKIM